MQDLLIPNKFWVHFVLNKTIKNNCDDQKKNLTKSHNLTGFKHSKKGTNSHPRYTCQSSAQEQTLIKFDSVEYFLKISDYDKNKESD